MKENLEKLSAALNGANETLKAVGEKSNALLVQLDKVKQESKAQSDKIVELLAEIGANSGDIPQSVVDLANEVATRTTALGTSLDTLGVAVKDVDDVVPDTAPPEN